MASKKVEDLRKKTKSNKKCLLITTKSFRIGMSKTKLPPTSGLAIGWKFITLSPKPKLKIFTKDEDDN